MRTTMGMLILGIAVALWPGAASVSSATENEDGSFQVLSLAAIGGADLPERNGWREISKGVVGIEYRCVDGVSGYCDFNVLTTRFDTSPRVCSQGAQVVVRDNVLVIPPDCH